jgi:hypothetical protein
VKHCVRLIDHDEMPGILDPYELRVRDVAGQPLTEADWLEDIVFTSQLCESDKTDWLRALPIPARPAFPWRPSGASYSATGFVD